jgi:CheY-like chemotaxis protein
MPTLLVVDDEPTVRSFVKESMTRRGWHVVGASTVDAALSVARTENIDVALCDVVMPFAGGPEFARALHSGSGNVPLVLMTGNPTAKALLDQPLPASARPVPVLEKPFKAAELQAVLERAMRLRDAADAAAKLPPTS